MPLTINALTDSTVAGAGVFDALMRSVKAHLEGEFLQNRIKGPEYSTVYLGSLNLAMQTGLQFLLQQQKMDIEVQLLTQQLALLTAQTANTVAEGLNIPKQGALLDAQVLSAQKQVEIADAEIEIKQQQVLVAQAEVGIAEAKLLNLPKEGVVLDAQAAQITQQTLNLASEKLDVEAKTALLGQQRTNLISENLGTLAKTQILEEQLQTETLKNFVHPTDPKLSGTYDQERQVLVAQECKLRAEFDLTTSQTVKSAQELALLAQKTTTERAQVTALGVDADSVVGRQKALYEAQTTGFQRDAEQKVAKLLVDTWSVRRTTDEATVADGTNLLHDATVGRAITKLLTGVGA